MAARPLVARQPNDRLASLIQEAGCSNAGLARRVNLTGAEHGLDLRYDKTSVARWLRGQQPRGRAPSMIAEALGRKLGRTVTVDEIGMAAGRNPGAGVGLEYAATVPAAVEQVCELWRGDVGRREFLTGRSVAASALVEPSRDWLISVPDPYVARSTGPRVGAGDVAAVEATHAALSELDHRFGSGHVRPVVVHYLNSVVAGLLTGSYREPVGRALFAAAARLTELAGYMAVDTGQSALAQRYYVQALRLAQAGGDRGYGGYVLAAGMSHLAAELGSPREIAQLARAAQEGTRGRVTPRTEAMFHAAEARGHAVLGDSRSCQLAAGRALSAFEKAGDATDAGEDPPWIAHFDAAYLADELAHCHRDLGQPAPARRRAEEAIAQHPEGRARRRAIGLLLLADAQAQQRDIDQACHTGARALDLLGGLRSRRSQEYLDGFRGRLEPFAQEPVVREFTARADLAVAA
ncbi:transcriptional regulator [Streptomyces sp. TRM 70351]|uniref:transcriptional regulator n=1 Tax=Streptomyces sp. TRM 70351 TaxID=3116552 RepID=UPI002E7B96B4|nr:transcriptional regulator [Streptomyces sp. TRM 70351]MEE1929566.1 transcriptional regulator [Streptomyces sp. TRM 70351]